MYCIQPAIGTLLRQRDARNYAVKARSGDRRCLAHVLSSLRARSSWQVIHLGTEYPYRFQDAVAQREEVEGERTPDVGLLQTGETEGGRDGSRRLWDASSPALKNPGRMVRESRRCRTRKGLVREFAGGFFLCNSQIRRLPQMTPCTFARLLC